MWSLASIMGSVGSHKHSLGPDTARAPSGRTRGDVGSPVARELIECEAVGVQTRAMQVQQPGGRVEVASVSPPSLEPGWVRVEVVATGVCGADLGDRQRVVEGQREDVGVR